MESQLNRAAYKPPNHSFIISFIFAMKLQVMAPSAEGKITKNNLHK
jgi:hypothetical protein